MKWILPSNIEKSIHRAYLDTGLIDLTAGLYFIAIGVISGMSQLPKMAVIFALIGIYHWIRMRIIQPRIGIYCFSIQRSRIFRLQNLFAALSTLVFLILILLSRMGLFDVNQWILTFSVCMLILLISYLFASILSFYRIMLYGGILVLNILMLNNPLVIARGEYLAILIMLIIPGIMISIYGIKRLLDFARKDHLNEGESDE